MRVESAELREVRLQLRERFEISSGGRRERRILLLRLDGEGAVGWGECVAAEEPNYSYETTETAWHLLTSYLLPAVVGREVSRARELLEPVAWIRGHRMAKAAVEMAGWDLEAKLRGVPVRTLLGGTRERIEVGVSVGLQPTDDDLFRQVEGYLAAGYRKIKLKIKPGRDVEMVGAVRERFGDIPLMVDANAAYRPEDAPRLRELDPLGLLMIEQPLGWDDLVRHAALQRELETPLCLDESITSPERAWEALELGSCRIINIKPGRVGGFGPSLRIHELARERGIPVWCGGMLESGVGRAHNIALATLPGFTIPGDISASRRYWERDLVRPEIEVEDGTITPPEGPGIGVEPDLPWIARNTVRAVRFGPEPRA